MMMKFSVRCFRKLLRIASWEVIGESEDGAFIEAEQLNYKKVDILFIDLLMPMRRH